MKPIIAALCFLGAGGAASAQDFYAGAGIDYLFPHSGDAQTAASIIAGVGLSRGAVEYGAEAEFGQRIAGDNDFDTQRLRAWATYPVGTVRARVAGGITEYDFGDLTSDGFNLGIGVERNFSDRVTLRGEFIRDFMDDDNFTAAVTTTRIGAFYNF